MRNHILSNTIYISRRLFKPLIGIATLFLTQIPNDTYAGTEIINPGLNPDGDIIGGGLVSGSCPYPMPACNLEGADQSSTYDPISCGKDADGTCLSTKCSSKSNEISAVNVGYKTTYGYTFVTRCSYNTNYCSCERVAIKHECATGYYGSAESRPGIYATEIIPSLSGCTQCPSGAICMGGNNSTYVCNTGYYHTPNAASGQYCTPCPSNATCMGGTETFKCNAGYYAASGTICTTCPTQSGYSGLTTAGATSSNQCYIHGILKPAWGSAEYSGQYYCSSNAYYQQ